MNSGIYYMKGNILMDKEMEKEKNTILIFIFQIKNHI